MIMTGILALLPIFKTQSKHYLLGVFFFVPYGIFFYWPNPTSRPYSPRFLSLTPLLCWKMNIIVIIEWR